MAEADADARKQALVEDLRWLFVSEAPETVVKETSGLVGQDHGTAKVSGDVHCVLGRESANLIGLEGVAKASANVHCVLGRESANLIGLEGAAKVSCDVHCVLGRVG